MTQEAESNVLHGQAVHNDVLASKEELAQSGTSLTMNNFICGIAYFPDKETVTNGTGLRRCGIVGNNCNSWQTFAFTFDAGFEVNRSAVSLSLLGISNASTASNMNYAFKDITSSQNGSKVTVTGQVLVGDSDGYLFQLSYLCIVA